MKIHYFVGASALFLAACSAERSEPDSNVAMAGNTSADQQEMAANEIIGDEETMEGRSIDGRWGIQYEACLPDNDVADGVIQISQYDVIVGLDACSITRESVADGFYTLEAICDNMEGGDTYAATYYFSSPQDGVLRWDNREFNRVEDYISCDGGALH